MIVDGKILQYAKDKMVVAVKEDISDVIAYQDITNIEIRLNDGRTINNDQRRKAYATIRDIADYTGHSPEYLKEWFKFDYLSQTGGEYFSLSDCSVTTAREYINHLIEFCIRHSVPIYHESLIHRTDDIDRYLYYCLLYRKCSVCGKAADIHHVTGSKIGMGGNRENTHHLGREAIALCRIHHEEAHRKEQEFFEQNHLYGIPLNKKLCAALGLKE